MADLDSILNGSDETETETEVIETEQVEEQPTETEAGVETGVAETQVAAETETPSEPDEVKGLRAAAAAERKKRQELEQTYQQELEQLRQQLAQRQQQEEERPFLGEEYEQRFAETETKLDKKVTDKIIMMSRELVKVQYADFEEKEREFMQLARGNDALIDQMRSSPNPALFAYKTASDHLQIQKLREIGDPVAYETSLRERIEAEVRAKVAAEQEEAKKAATEAAIRSKLPKTGFAEERSSGTARATPERYSGPTPLKNILG